MLDTDTRIDILELILFDEARCDSRAKHSCTVKARWSSTATCTRTTRLWCDARYALWVKQTEAGWFCGHCDRLQTSCWTVRPV